MFSVVGLIGMVGIIVNDSIVLVTTIDEHARDRGLFPAIVEGAADRLRPVLLTTLTTVLGLTPLLYEGSTQAQFLKPTVITLVYGLGFGLVLVLLVVPALMAIQHDFRRHRNALFRGLRAGRGLTAVLGGTGAAIAALFAGTIGWRLATGTLPEPFAALLPAVAAESLAAALGLFVAGAGILTALAWMAGALALRPRG